MAETVLTLHESPVSPVVLQETLRELVIDASAPLTLTLTAPAQTACSLVVRIRQAEALTIQVRAEAASQLTLLYWNESSAPITIRESNEIYRDARFKAAYVQLNPGMVDHQSKTLLKESGAEALVQSAVIAQTRKQFVVDLIHQAGQTTGIMENYSIVLQGGRYRMEGDPEEHRRPGFAGRRHGQHAGGTLRVRILGIFEGGRAVGAPAKTRPVSYTHLRAGRCLPAYR